MELEDKYAEYQTGEILGFSRRKLLLEMLLEDAKKEKPTISQNSLQRFIRSKMPFWGEGRSKDYAASLHAMIMRLPNVEKPLDSKV